MQIFPKWPYNTNLTIDPKYTNIENDKKFKEVVDRFKQEYMPHNTYAEKDTPMIQAFQALRVEKLLTNMGTYKPSNLFRNRELTVGIHTDPETGNDTKLTNYPLIYDFIKPYQPKIDIFNVFFVVSNNYKKLKGEEQIKLIENSMSFIGKLSGSKKKTCAQ